MYDTILIGVKGDPDDASAIELARRLASPPSRLTLVHVSVISAFGSEREGLELQINAPGELARAFADQLTLAGEGARLIREHATSVGAGLQAAASRVDPELLVLGPTRHRGLDRVLEGDDVQAAVTRTRCAVAVADSEAAPGRRPITRIGLAYDATPEGTAAAQHAGALAAALGATLTPLYVAAPHLYAPGFGMVAYPFEDPEAVLAAARTDMGSVAGEKVNVIYGDPGYELTAFSSQVDLLVCGSRRQRGFRRFVFGSTALTLSREARCPLIIAPPPEPTATATSAEPASAHAVSSHQ